MDTAYLAMAAWALGTIAAWIIWIWLQEGWNGRQ